MKASLGPSAGSTTVLAAVLGLALLPSCRQPASSEARMPPPAVGATPTAPLLVRMTSRQHEWHVTHAGPDGRLDTADDVSELSLLRLPADTEVRLELRSEDFVQVLSLPYLGLEQIAVPDLEFDLELTSGPAGRQTFRARQLCGQDGSRLQGEVHVMPREAFAAWLK